MVSKVLYADYMATIKPQSQRNNPNAKDLLGFAKHGQTIHDFGCTITCIAMFAGITPGEVNERLKKVSGFQETLVIWTKIHAAIPWIDFVWRGTSYDNNKVADAIKDNGACLVEVDFDGTPRTDDRHWILYVGNGRMNDPWTGTERATGSYTAMGYAILKRTGNPPSENNGGMSMDVQQLLSKYKLQDLADLDRKLEEHVGLNWGSEEKDGGHLGAARRDVTRLKKELSTALNTPVTPPSSPSDEVLEETTVNGKKWVLNGLNRVDGKWQANYKRSE